MPTNFEQGIQATQAAFLAGSLPPGFLITPQSDGSVAVDRQVMESWDFPKRSRILSAATSPAISPGTSMDSGVHSGVDDRRQEQQLLETLIDFPQDEVLTTLQATFRDLSDSQQSQLAEIKPLVAKDPDTFKARMAALRKSTIDSVNKAIDKAYDDLKNAGLKAPQTQPAILEAVQRVAQLAQGFIATASSAFDTVDHAGALVIGGLSEGATEVANAFTTAANALEDAGKTVLNGIESVFSGW